MAKVTTRVETKRVVEGITLELTLEEARALRAALKPIYGLDAYTDVEDELGAQLERLADVPGRAFDAILDFEHDIFVRSEGEIDDDDIRWKSGLGCHKYSEGHEHA